MNYQEDILAYFNRGTWNWLIHSVWVIIIGIIVWIPLVFLGFRYGLLSKNLMIALLSLFPAPGFVLDISTARIYPNLVIEDGTRHLGRSIKNDLKIILLIILLPILLNIIAALIGKS